MATEPRKDLFSGECGDSWCYPLRDTLSKGHTNNLSGIRVLIGTRMPLDLAQKVAARFIEASYDIEVNEVGANIEVSGHYDKMKNLIPYLRGKLVYREQDHTWWVPKAKMTPLKIKNLQKKVDEINGFAKPEPTKVDEAAEAKAARIEKVKELIDRAVHLRVPGLKFVLVALQELRLIGALTDLRISINKSGGEYGAEISNFFPASIKPVEFEKLLEAVEDQGKLVAKALAKLSSIVPRDFPNLKIKVDINNGGYLLVISGKTYDYKDWIKARIPVTFNSSGSYWYVPIHQVKEAHVRDVVEYLESKERELAEKWKAEQDSSEQSALKPERKRTNQRGDHCLDCGGWVEPGKGWLVNYYDSEPGDFVWKVRHKNPEDCAKVRAEQRIRSEAARTRSEARKNLMLMCEKSEYYVQGTEHRPPGEEIYIDKKSLGYGGGTWVVIEPGENYFWYVRNNGADGDDWSRNNVLTGGAGAIGYRLPMTDEARVLIDVAKEG